MTSLERMIGVLDLFEGEARRLSVEAMQRRLGYTRSTLYRYLKVLTDAGLLATLPDLGYALGPRVIELDYQIRARDPMIAAARPVMAGLVEQTPGIALLCQRYRDKVLCVHQERGTDTFHSGFERGRARPLLRGAASRVILAHLPAPRIASLYERQPAEFGAAGLGSDLSAVRAALRTIRRQGWDRTAGHVTEGVAGIAAPIFDSRKAVVGSLSITIAQRAEAPEKLMALTERVVFCAGIVTKALAREEDVDR